MTDQKGFKYPNDIHLPNNPLAEAWLELRWRTADLPARSPNAPPIGPVDTHYQLALGAFYGLVSDRYGVQEPLPASQFPPDAVPHQVTYRFSQVGSGLPLLQLGPGVASVNFAQEYSWEAFRGESLYLREKLLDAYKGHKMVPLELVLRYRDLFAFDFRNGDVVSFLRHKLNIDLAWPAPIPGHVAARTSPSSVGLNLGFDIQSPPALGSIRLATAIHTTDEGIESPVVLAEFEMRAREVTPNLLEDSEHFTKWLDDAHAAVHDWFFALIDGDLFEDFQKGK